LLSGEFPSIVLLPFSRGFSRSMQLLNRVSALGLLSPFRCVWCAGRSGNAPGRRHIFSHFYPGLSPSTLCAFLHEFFLFEPLIVSLFAFITEDHGLVPTIPFYSSWIFPKGASPASTILFHQTTHSVVLLPLQFFTTIRLSFPLPLLISCRLHFDRTRSSPSIDLLEFCFFQSSCSGFSSPRPSFLRIPDYLECQKAIDLIA